MKDGDYGEILGTIFGANNIFEGQTTDIDVFEFTDFGKIVDWLIVIENLFRNW
jgi:hypothetical protein